MFAPSAMKVHSKTEPWFDVSWINILTHFWFNFCGRSQYPTQCTFFLDYRFLNFNLFSPLKTQNFGPEVWVHVHSFWAWVAQWEWSDVRTDWKLSQKFSRVSMHGISLKPCLPRKTFITQLLLADTEPWM